MLLRRRRSPTYWTDLELLEQIRAVYLGGVSFVSDAHGAVTLAGVVFHQDARLFPRRMLRRVAREDGGLAPYCFYGVWWNDYLQGCVNMGDEPIDTFRAYSGHETETSARRAAKTFLAEDGDQPWRDVAMDEVDPFGRGMILYVLRRGARYFAV